MYLPNEVGVSRETVCSRLVADLEELIKTGAPRCGKVRV